MFTIDTTIYKSIDELLDSEVTFITSNKKIEYANVPCTIDIESSSFYDNGEKRGIMYAFVIGINGKCYIARTYNELWESMNKIASFYGLNEKRRMIFYIQNLAFEFQWFRKWRTWDKVFATEERTPLYALDNTGIEYRCSYLLSGYSLENIGKNLTKYKVNKKSGDLDYKLIRHSETPLTDKEMGYILYDGLVVMCYIQEEIENHHNNITLIPLTKTGKVRKHVRRICLYGKSRSDVHKFEKYHNMMLSLPITSIQEYEQLKRAFHGGFTHANSFYVNQIVYNVYSDDFTSSYPYVLVSEMFPMGKGELITIHSKEEFYSNLKKYCCLFDCTFTDIEPLFIYEHPISISKCSSIKGYTADNGRLVDANEITITLTEQDFAIIRKFYTWKHLRIKNFRRYKKNYLPRDFIRAVLMLYEKKTTLKGIEEFIVEYMNSKEMLNACYGMSVTDICRTEIEYGSDNLWGKVPPTPEEDIEKYNKKKNRFICYQWGVWCTAYAMRNLFTAIYELKDDYIYSDTDSVKFINIEKHKKYFEDYNANVVRKLKRMCENYNLPFSMCSPLTKDGIEKTIGLWDFDGFYKRFKTLGAKRYMVEYEKPINYGTKEKPLWIPYSLTVSGVNKKTAIPYLYKENNDKIMDVFTDGLVIPPQYTGKNIHTYIDEETRGIVTDYLGKSIEYHEYSSVHLEESGYELSLSREFIDYLLGIRLVTQ